MSDLITDHNRRMQWWRKAKFGMFIHYGIYSALEGVTPEGERIAFNGAEWYQERTGIDGPTYHERAFAKFTVKPNAAKEWAKLAKDAGCEYVVLTTKHHDGFVLFDSKLEPEYSSQNKIGRDVVAEYVAACRAEGLKIGFYHSTIDWHNPNYNYKIGTGLPFPAAERVRCDGEVRDHKKYIEYLHKMVLDELLTNYGPIDIIWFDFSSMNFEGDEAWESSSLVKKIRAQCPNIIMNNRLFRRPEAGFRGQAIDEFTSTMDVQFGDFITPENSMPKSGILDADWEACYTLNDNWGWSKVDSNWKSATECIRMLVDSVAKGGNFLLNIGPMGDGTVPVETAVRFAEIGAWTKANEESFKETTALPFEEMPSWGRVVQKGNVLYFHIFEKPESGKITFETPAKVLGAKFVAEPSTKLAFTSEGDKHTILLSGDLLDKSDTVIKVELDSTVKSIGV